MATMHRLTGTVRPDDQLGTDAQHVDHCHDWSRSTCRTQHTSAADLTAQHDLTGRLRTSPLLLDRDGERGVVRDVDAGPQDDVVGALSAVERADRDGVTVLVPQPALVVGPDGAGGSPLMSSSISNPESIGAMLARPAASGSSSVPAKVTTADSGSSFPVTATVATAPTATAAAAATSIGAHRRRRERRSRATASSSTVGAGPVSSSARRAASVRSSRSTEGQPTAPPGGGSQAAGPAMPADARHCPSSLTPRSLLYGARCANSSLSRRYARYVRDFTVLIGMPRRSAVSLWVSPSTYATYDRTFVDGQLVQRLANLPRLPRALQRRPVRGRVGQSLRRVDDCVPALLPPGVDGRAPGDGEQPRRNVGVRRRTARPARPAKACCTASAASS